MFRPCDRIIPTCELLLVDDSADLVGRQFVDVPFIAPRVRRTISAHACNMVGRLLKRDTFTPHDNWKRGYFLLTQMHYRRLREDCFSWNSTGNLAVFRIGAIRIKEVHCFEMSATSYGKWV